jgi:hypothetical protein
MKQFSWAVACNAGALSLSDPGAKVTCGRRVTRTNCPGPPGLRGHKPSCLRGGNSCVCFDAVVDRRASLVVRRRYNLILNLAGVATMADWMVPPIAISIFLAIIIFAWRWPR